MAHAGAGVRRVHRADDSPMHGADNAGAMARSLRLIHQDRGVETPAFRPGRKRRRSPSRARAARQAPWTARGEARGRARPGAAGCGDQLGPALGVADRCGDQLGEVRQAVGGAGRKRPPPRRRVHHAPQAAVDDDRARRQRPDRGHRMLRQHLGRARASTTRRLCAIAS